MYNLFSTGDAKSTDGGSITEGIGLGRVTPIIDDIKVEKPYLIPDEEAVPIIFDLLEHEGLCLGGSSGINVAGAIRLAKDLGPGNTIVTVLCDYGTRYQSKLFNPEFLRSKKLPVPAWLEKQVERRNSVREGLRLSLHGHRLPVPRGLLSHRTATRPSSAIEAKAASCSTAPCFYADLRRPAGRPRHADRAIGRGDRRSPTSMFTDPAQDRRSLMSRPPGAPAVAVGDTVNAHASTGACATPACACTRRCICSPRSCPIR